MRFQEAFLERLAEHLASFVHKYSVQRYFFNICFRHHFKHLGIDAYINENFCYVFGEYGKCDEVTNNE